MKYSLAKFLSIITALLMLMLISVFAGLVKAAFDHRHEAQRIVSIVTVKRDMLICQEAMRVEGALLDTALEEENAAPPGTVDQIARLHARSQEAFAHMRRHQTNQFASGYDEFLRHKALVRQHCGKFSIESQENSGTCVTVELPLVQPDRVAAWYLACRPDRGCQSRRQMA